jgi:hypothetical protein
MYANVWRLQSAELRRSGAALPQQLREVGHEGRKGAGDIGRGGQTN